MDHEKAIEAAALAMETAYAQGSQSAARAAIAAFLRTVEPSEKMREDGRMMDGPLGKEYAAASWAAMCRALAEEIDNAKG